MIFSISAWCDAKVYFRHAVSKYYFHYRKYFKTLTNSSGYMFIPELDYIAVSCILCVYILHLFSYELIACSVPSRYSPPSINHITQRCPITCKWHNFVLYFSLDLMLETGLTDIHTYIHTHIRTYVGIYKHCYYDYLGKEMCKIAQALDVTLFIVLNSIMWITYTPNHI